MRAHQGQVLLLGVVPAAHGVYWLFAGLFVQFPQLAELVPALNLPVPHAMHFWMNLLLPMSTKGVPAGRSVPASHSAHEVFVVPVPSHALDTPLPAAHLTLSSCAWPSHHSHVREPIWSVVVQLTYVPIVPQLLVAHSLHMGSLVDPPAL